MGKKLMHLEVAGRTGAYGFTVEADPRYLEEWQADGVEIYLIENTIPMWVVNAGLVRPWCFLQDVFNLRNPFKWSKK